MKLFEMLDRGLNEKEDPITLGQIKKDSENNTEAEVSADLSLQGLTQEEAERRLAHQGKNELQAHKRASAIAIFFSQYKDIMTVILLICTAVSLFMGEYVEAVAIAIIVLMNGFLGFIQEYRTCLLYTSLSYQIYVTDNRQQR